MHAAGVACGDRERELALAVSSASSYFFRTWCVLSGAGLPQFS
jgi:hypothetical protein